MFLSRHTKLFAAAWVATSLLLIASLSRSVRGQDGQSDHEPTNMTVIVKEAATGEPISQARVTLQFTVPRGHGLGGGRNTFTMPKLTCRADANYWKSTREKFY